MTSPTHDEGNGLAIAALVLGILSVPPVGLVFLGPVAWVMGVRAKRAVDEGRTAQHRGLALAGQILGIVGTVCLVLGLIIVAVIIIVVASDDTPGY